MSGRIAFGFGIAALAAGAFLLTFAGVGLKIGGAGTSATFQVAGALLLLVGLGLMVHDLRARRRNREPPSTPKA